MGGYMFDTNIFNAILDGGIDIHQLNHDNAYFVTHIQFDELQNTRNDERRNQLIQIFTLIAPTSTPTETFILDVSRLGKAKLGDSQIYTDIKNYLDSRNNSKENNIQDALIAETAILQNLTLVTNDRHLLSTTIAFKGFAINLRDFLLR
jgi:predicted nucleic acid-binding protein